MNTEKLEKLKKSLDNKFIPDNMKDKIRVEIQKLESEIKTDDTITATEVKEEVKEIEKKVEKALEVADKKEEQAKAKAPRKPRQKKVKETETKKPKSNKKSVFSVAKEIRKAGESWEDAKKRASKMMKSENTETKTKVRTETSKLLASIRRKKELKNLSGTNIKSDMNRTALPKGRRVSKKGWKNQYGESEGGRVYYENRDNRTDRLAPSYKDKIYLADGGGLKFGNYGENRTAKFIDKNYEVIVYPEKLEILVIITNEDTINQEGLDASGVLWRKEDFGYSIEADNKTEFNKAIKVILGVNKRFADGGTIIGTPETPLGRDLGISYTGLVGETGAMSSGEMFANGGGVGKKPTLKKGDVVEVVGRRWFDRVNGNTYHTAEVFVNDKFVAKSRMTYGYDEQYLQTAKELLLENYNLPKGMKETSPLWQLREYGVTLTKSVSDGLKRDLEDGGFMDGVYAKGGGVRRVGNREYSTGRNWTNDHKHVNKSEEHEVKYTRKRTFAGGGGVGDESPKIYVADLEAYNNGRLSGVWLDLMDYNDADELMSAIQDFLKTTGGEEYAIHDVENIPSKLYSEYMGQRDFEELYEMIDLAKDNDLPLEVVIQVVSEYGTSAVDEFMGKYDSADDFAQELVDDTGIESFIDFERYLIVSDTDRRLLAQEMADNYVDDIRDEDGGNRLIEEANLDLSEYEEADEDRQEEMLDEAREIVYDEYYDTWYDGLSDPYYFLVEEQGLYSAEDFANASFVQIDYEALAEALEYDYAFIYNDGDLYVFNIR
jgi:antirestriction protein